MSDITSMYNGTVLVQFEDKAKQHRYLVNGKEKPGVTTIIKQALNAGPSMTWPMWEAINWLKEHDGDFDGASKAYLTKSTKGADTGTQVHALIETYLKTDAVALDAAMPAEVAKALNGFCEWYQEQNVKALEIEQVIYSKDGDYAGKFDALFMLDGKVVLVDFKTTNKSQEAPKGIYWSNFVQLGGYGYARTEMGDCGIDDYAVINAGKDGKCNVVFASDLDLSVEDCNLEFMAALEVYRFRNRVMRSLKGETSR